LLKLRHVDARQRLAAATAARGKKTQEPRYVLVFNRSVHRAQGEGVHTDVISATLRFHADFFVFVLSSTSVNSASTIFSLLDGGAEVELCDCA
jgi:hypothetical protein